MEQGVITQVSITVGETVPHPYAQYASLKAEVTLTAALNAEGEIALLRARAMPELDATMKVMQERADALYKGHTKIRE